MNDEMRRWIEARAREVIAQEVTPLIHERLQQLKEAALAELRRNE